MNNNTTIKLIAFDLDGTLTNEEKVITPHTVDMLLGVQSHGVRLCLASGRPPYGMKPLADQLQMAKHGGILLCYNGGHIEMLSETLPTDGKPQVLVEQALDEALLPELHQFQEQSGLTLMTYYEDHIYTEHPDDPYVLQSSRNNKMSVVKVRNFISDTPRPLNKCLMVGPPERIPEWEEKMQQAMKGRMNICRSTPYFIELLPMGIDKGDALAKLLPQLNLTRDNLMAFGDSYNDISMLQFAGVGVAMQNADDAVKEAADYITDSNEDEGVLRFLQNHRDMF